MATNRQYRRLTTRVLLIACMLSLGLMAAAQADDISGTLRVPEPDVTQILSLNDGSTLIGHITAIGDDSITFETEHGEMTIAKSKITEIREVSSSSVKGGKVWFPNPNQTRLYFGPTGRTLKQGEGYFHDIYLFFPSITYGLTDNITLSGGISIFPVDEIGEQFIYFTPKVGFEVNEKWSLAGTAMILRVPDWLEDDDINNDGTDDIVDVLGLVFATTTYGTPDKSITFGLGFGFADSDIADEPTVLQIGGEYRLSRRLSFVTENWVFPEVDQPLMSYGLRFFNESLAIDLAFFNVLDDNAFFPGIPFLDFVYNF